MGKGERSCTEAEAHDLRCRPEENRDGAASAVGEGEERSVKSSRREFGGGRCVCLPGRSIEQTSRVACKGERH
jgi:hypothetical protein